MSKESYRKILTKKSEHHFSLKTSEMQVPAEFLMNENLLPAEETFRQIESIATHGSLFQATAAMPDVMSKPGRKNAAGTTVVSDTHILPQVNDSDPNCGMRVVATNLTDQNTTPEQIDELFEALVPEVPTKAYVGTRVPFHVVVDICRKGTQAIIDHLGIDTKDELINTQGGGNYFGRELSKQDIFDVIPKLYLHFAQFRLGITGAAGNHFLDLMKITDIVSEKEATKMGLNKGQYVFMIHTGSGILGQYTMYTYTAKVREHLSQTIMTWIGHMTFSTRKKETYKSIAKKVRYYMKHKIDSDELFTFDSVKDPEATQMYMNARAAASNFGVANRATITHNVSQVAKQVLGRDIEARLVYDLPHVSVTQEEHFGKDVWVHRSNVTRAYGPQKMKDFDHPLYSKIGEPVFIPSSMSTEAFIGLGTDRNDTSYFSAPHGTGKGVEISEENAPQDRDALMAKMASRGVKLYNGKSSKTVEQDSSRYKDVSQVMAGVEENGIAKVIAKMEPVAVIMY